MDRSYNILEAVYGVFNIIIIYCYGTVQRFFIKQYFYALHCTSLYGVYLHYEILCRAMQYMYGVIFNLIWAPYNSVRCVSRVVNYHTE